MPEEFPISERAMWPAVRMAICIPLTMLEPAIIQANLAGQQPRCMSLLWFQRNPLPTDWVAQGKVVAAFDV